MTVISGEDGTFSFNNIPYGEYVVREIEAPEAYEVPFTRLFYKFIAPVASDDIFAEIKALEAEETVLMNELFHKE